MSQRPYIPLGKSIPDDFPERRYRVGRWKGFTQRERRIIEAYLKYPGRAV